MRELHKLREGDKVAIVSPSTAKLDATVDEKASDLIAAFSDPSIKAVLSTLGGDIQVTHIKNLSPEVFANNPKPFFGYSDCSHFSNFLFLNGIPSFYGAALFTQFAMRGEMDQYTVRYINHALFDDGEFELLQSEVYSDIDLALTPSC